MNWIKIKYNGLLRRMKLCSLGIFYLKSSSIKIPQLLRINNHFKEIKFVNRTEHNFFYEFHDICINDCYHLKRFKKILPDLKTIVDIGANQSLFTIAARRIFPNAKIYSYEPNKQLEKILTFNSNQLNAKVYYEAVTSEDCQVQLVFGDSDLNTQTRKSKEGEINGTSFKRVIERAGGNIDLLKLDCEGAEWDLFEDEISWQNVNGLTMEYHLWAKEGSHFEDIKSILFNLNFLILSHEATNDTFGMLTAINLKNNIKNYL